MKTTNLILLVLGIFLAIFIVAMVVIFCVKGMTPDVLIQCVLGGSGLEAFILAGIKITKTIKGETDYKDDTDQNHIGF